jgi:Ca2+-binding RTX toxin-like protein
MTNRTWTGITNNDWSTSGNWDPAGTPQSGDNLTVTSGTPTVSSGSTITSEAIVLNGATVTTPVSLTAIDTTFNETFSALTTLTAFSTATLRAEGNTSFDGQIYVQATGGRLTIDSESDGTNAGNFTLSNSDDAALVLVSHESSLHLAAGTGGSTITNDATIEVDGAAVVEKDASVTTTQNTTGFWILENGGNLSVQGSMDAGQQIDFYDSTGLLTIAQSGLTDTVFNPSIQFNGTMGHIDLAGISALSERVIDNLLTLYSGANATGSVVAQLNQFHSKDYSVDSSDFTVGPEGKGGTAVTYNAGGSTYLTAALAVPIVAAPNPTGAKDGRIPLSTILDQSFGTSSPPFYDITLEMATSTANNAPNDNGYWAPSGTQAVQPIWYLDGQPITSATTIKPEDISRVELSPGNSITPITFNARVTQTKTGADSAYVTYSVFTVDPRVAAQLTGTPTPAEDVASANAFNATFQNIQNTNYCYVIASNVAAAAGAPISPNSEGFLEPTNDVPGGFWRIIYSGVNQPAPVSNWSTLVQPGDFVSMAWGYQDQKTALGEVDGHTTTVVAGGGPGNTAPITVYDNVYYTSNSKNAPELIGEHPATYWLPGAPGGTTPSGGLGATDPASIVIWRLDPHQQYLIQGAGVSEIIQGSIYNNLIQPDGGNDTITAGLGNNEIQDTTANLNGITVTDYHLGDTFDFTDLNPAQAKATFVDGTSPALHVLKSGKDVAQIAIPTPPAGATFAVRSDGQTGSLIGLTVATKLDKQHFLTSLGGNIDGDTQTEIINYLAGKGFYTAPGATAAAQQSVSPPVDPFADIAEFSASNFVPITTATNLTAIIATGFDAHVQLQGSIGVMLAAGNGNDALDLTDSGNDYVIAGNGNNWIATGQGEDTVFAGDGNDAVYIGLNGITTGNQIFGGSGNGTFVDVSDGANSITGGTGNVSIYAVGNGNDLLVGGSANNYIVVTGTGVDTAEGSTGNSTLVGTGGGTYSLVGGNGNDFLQAVGSGNETLLGGNGNSTLAATGGGTYSLVGGNGNDLLEAAGSGNETLLGGNGNSTLIAGGAGTYSLVGGNGIDVLQAAGSGNETLLGGNGRSTLVALDGGNYSLVGGNANDFLQAAGSGNETLLGGNGNSTLAATGGGTYSLIGGNGNDLLEAAGSGSEMLIGGNGTATLVAGGTGTYSLVGGNGNDWLQAAGFANETLVGGNGNSTLIATGGGNYSLVGGNGNDFLQAAGSGIETLLGGNGDSTLVASGGGTYSLVGGNGNDLLQATGSGNETLLGGNGNSTLTATGTGNYSLVGGNGSDRLLAFGSGNETVLGGNGNDTIQAGGSGNETINGGGGNDFIGITGSGNYSITGSTANTHMAFYQGNTGNNDTLSGGASGNDTVTFVGFNGNSPTTIVNTTGNNWTVTFSGGQTVFLQANGSNTTTLNFTGDNFTKVI